MTKSDSGLHAPGWRKALDAANAAPRCGAKTRAGAPCEGPGMANGRCRMRWRQEHGAAHGRGLGAVPAGQLETWPAVGGVYK